MAAKRLFYYFGTHSTQTKSVFDSRIRQCLSSIVLFTLNLFFSHGFVIILFFRAIKKIHIETHMRKEYTRRLCISTEKIYNQKIAELANDWDGEERKKRNNSKQQRIE